MMGTRPQTIGYAFTDSPAGLAAWMFDYNNAEPLRLLTRDEMLDDVTLYWLTNTAGLNAAGSDGYGRRCPGFIPYTFPWN